MSPGGFWFLSPDNVVSSLRETICSENRSIRYYGLQITCRLTTGEMNLLHLPLDLSATSYVRIRTIQPVRATPPSTQTQRTKYSE